MGEGWVDSFPSTPPSLTDRLLFDALRFDDYLFFGELFDEGITGNQRASGCRIDVSNKRAVKAVCRVSCISQCAASASPPSETAHRKQGEFWEAQGWMTEPSTQKIRTSLDSGLPATCNPGALSQRVGPQRVGYTDTTHLELL